MSSAHEATWLTQEAHDRLSSELVYLLDVARKDIARKIGEAREEGDLKENGGYHAAKDEQGKIEARIRTLTALLKDVKVGEAPESSGVVETGTVITAKIAGEESVFLLGNREIAAGTDYTVYSESSPMGAAILGLKVGEKTIFTAPNGKDIAVEVINVATFTG